MNKTGQTSSMMGEDITSFFGSTKNNIKQPVLLAIKEKESDEINKNIKKKKNKTK